MPVISLSYTGPQLSLLWSWLAALLLFIYPGDIEEAERVKG